MPEDVGIASSVHSKLLKFPIAAKVELDPTRPSIVTLTLNPTSMIGDADTNKTMLIAWLREPEQGMTELADEIEAYDAEQADALFDG